MALEPITRQEKIIAGQDLTPITRMEKFLKQYGGGPGRVTSWNDLTDKPFGEVTAVEEVLAECQPIYHAAGDTDGTLSSFGIRNPFEIVPGEKYIVSWNGTDYLSTAVGIEGVVFLGNLSTVGMEDTGEPFVMQMTDGTPEAPGHPVEYALVIPLDGSTTLTISIRQEVTEVKQISGKFVEGMGYVEKVYVLPECQPDFDETIDDGVNIFSIVSPFVAVDGERYIVTFNGEDYECVGIAETDNNPAGLGNMSLFAPLVPVFEDSGEPFWIAFLPNNLMLVNTKCDTPSISIRQETIHPIDQKFLPSGGGQFVVTFSMNPDAGGVVADKTATEIIEAVKANMHVVAVAQMGPNFYVYQYQSHYDDGGNTPCYVVFYAMSSEITAEGAGTLSYTEIAVTDGYDVVTRRMLNVGATT